MPSCLIGLGSNLGDRQQTLSQAVEQLKAAPHVHVAQCSRWHATAPIGGPAGQGEFLNGAVRMETSLAPEDLWALLRRIEDRLGRTRSQRWVPRILDLDLLLYDEQVVDTPSLVIPHPAMAYRRFVLVPAAEVALQMVHPKTGWTIARLLDHLNTATPYVAITGPIGAGKTRLAEGLSKKFGARRIEDPVDPNLRRRLGPDPSGPALPAEIELLERRARQLERASWPSDASLTVSDYWFAQTLAYAEVRLIGTDSTALVEAWEEARRRVTPCKLLVVLDATVDASLAAVRSQGRASGKQWNHALLERLRQSIRNLVNRPGWGPVLQLATDDPLGELEQAAAAIESMR